jgi:hypothetical protein
MRVTVVVASIFLALSFTACGRTNYPIDRAGEKPALLFASTPEPGATHGEANDWGEIKLVRTAAMQLEVAKLDTAKSEIERATKAEGGLVVTMASSRDERDGLSAEITLRVPSSRFDELLPQLRNVGKVEQENVTSQDVSKQYADLETRLGVKQQTERRLRGLLESHTGKLSDVLEVERELDRVVGEIEQMLGEKRFYDHQVALSKVTLSLHEPGSIVKPGAFDPIRRAFRNSLEALATSAAGIVYAAAVALPWMIVAGLVWFVISRVRRTRKAG